MGQIPVRSAAQGHFSLLKVQWTAQSCRGQLMLTWLSGGGLDNIELSPVATGILQLNTDAVAFAARHSCFPPRGS
jgi:hypothetical protein